MPYEQQVQWPNPALFEALGANMPPAQAQVNGVQIPLPMYAQQYQQPQPQQHYQPQYAPQASAPLAGPAPSAPAPETALAPVASPPQLAPAPQPLGQLQATVQPAIATTLIGPVGWMALGALALMIFGGGKK